MLHATQTTLFLVVPRIFEAGGLPVASHLEVYLSVMGLAFVMMVPAIVVAEKRGKMKAVLVSAIGLVLIGQVLLGLAPHKIFSVAAILFLYFLGFNNLEALQPSLLSKLAPGTRKGAATGVYKTTQSIGLAMGGVLGGGYRKSTVRAQFSLHARDWSFAGSSPPQTCSHRRAGRDRLAPVAGASTAAALDSLSNVRIECADLITLRMPNYPHA